MRKKDYVVSGLLSLWWIKDNLVESNVDVSFLGSLDNVGKLDNLLCGNIKVIIGKDTKTRLSDLLDGKKNREN